VPDPPGVPFKISSTINNIVINWTESAFNGGNIITNYNVYIATSQNSTPIFYNSTNNASVLTMKI